MQEEELLVDLDYELDIPCVVRWFMLWFSAPSRLNQTFDGEGKHNVKYHEVVDVAITETISLPFGGSHTPQRCLFRN